MKQSKSTETASSAPRGAPATLAPGTVIASRFEVRELLGRGGFATVYGVYDRELNAEVALKVLRQDRMRPDAIARLRREVLVARAAATPRLVHVFDIGVSDEIVYLTMERIRGESLRDRLRRGPFEVEQAIPLAISILEGIRDVHKLGVLHRDIKPENILIDQAGCVRIADFGLARYEHEDSRLTDNGGLLGSADYVSPEQALGETLDARTDLYSFGVVLFEMLTGDVPFPKTTSIGAVLARVTNRPPDLSKLRPAMPSWLCDLLRRLLERERELRCASADDVIDALRRQTADRGLNKFRRLRLSSRIVVMAGITTIAIVLTLLTQEITAVRAYQRRLSVSPKGAALRAADCNLCPAGIDQFLARAAALFDHDLKTTYLPRLNVNRVRCFPAASRRSFEGKTYFAKGTDWGSGLFVERLMLQRQLTGNDALLPLIADYAALMAIDPGDPSSGAISDVRAPAIGRFAVIAAHRDEFERRLAAVTAGGQEDAHIRRALRTALDAQILAVREYCQTGYTHGFFAESFPDDLLGPLIHTVLVDRNPDAILNGAGDSPFVASSLASIPPVRYSDVLATLVNRAFADSEVLVAHENGRSFSLAYFDKTGRLLRKTAFSDPGFASPRDEDQSVVAGEHARLMVVIATAMYVYDELMRDRDVVKRLRREFDSEDSFRAYEHGLATHVSQMRLTIQSLKRYYVAHLRPDNGLPPEYFFLAGGNSSKTTYVPAPSDALAALRYAYAMTLLGDAAEVRSTLKAVLAYGEMNGSPAPPSVPILRSLGLFTARSVEDNPPLESGLLKDTRFELPNWYGTSIEADLLLCRLLWEIRHSSTRHLVSGSLDPRAGQTSERN